MGLASRFAWLASTALFFPVAAQAQTVVTEDEIIVTAQKREQRLIDVPLAVTALTADTLEAQGAADLEDVQYTVPGLSMQNYGPGYGFTQMRGVANIVGRPTIGNYLNEMPTNIETAGPTVNVRLIDMERIEVLRGPQPTLYGEGAMGGTIRYITAAPELTTFSGALEAEANSVEDGEQGYNANGHLNIPLVTDRLGVRLVAGYEDAGGWIDRTSTGEEDINGYTIGTFRGEVLARFGSNASLSLLGLHQELNHDTQNFAIDRETSGTFDLPLSTDTDLAIATFRYDFGFAELVAVAGYLGYDINSSFDISAFYVPFLEAPPPFGFGLPAGFITQIPLIGDIENQVTTQEVRLVSQGDSALSWAIGANRREVSTETVSATTTAPGALPFDILRGVSTNESELLGLWAEVGYQFTDRLQATVGARYFTDDATTRGFLVSFGAPSFTDAGDTFESVNPKLNINYQVADDWLLYFNAGKGFRSGGFNTTSLTTPTYAPEELWSYELGSKGSYFDRTLTFEADVYWTSWKDVQTNFFTPAGLTITTNGGSIEGWGADLAVTWMPIENFQVGATYGWNNLEYVEVPVDALGNPSSDKAVGDPPDLTVQENWAAFASYRHPLTASVTGFARVDYQHAANNQITLRSPIFDQIVTNEARDLLNVSLGAEFDNFTLTLFANNVTDEDAPVIQGPFGVITENVEQRPRVVGVNVRTTF